MAPELRQFGRQYAAAVILVSLATTGTSCDREYTSRSHLAEADRLTERIAVDRALEAIGNAGYDKSLVEPACYRNPCDTSEPYFARNTLNPNRGYVLLRFKADSRRAYHLNVTIERQGD
jgi:hypothetical protein